MSTVSTSLPLARELREICGAQHVVEDPAELSRMQVLGVAPAVAVEPASPEEVAAILRFAAERGLNVVPAGGFTQQQNGNVPPAIDVLLSISRLTAIEHYDPGDLTIGVGAGWTVAQLASKVAAHRLLFACDPPLAERATIGGVLATGISGPLRHGYGGLRDYCIGVRFVTGDGRIGKGGGQVVKNVAGYDLMKLLIGSWGTLAVITSASFKLFPAPRQTRTFVAEFSTAAEALEFRSRVLRSPLDPACLELISPEAGALLAKQDVSSPARTPGPPTSAGFALGGVGVRVEEPAVGPQAEESSAPATNRKAWLILIRAAGSDAVLTRYRKELGAAASREIDGQAENDLWGVLQNFQHNVCESRPDSALISMSLPLADVQPVLRELESVAKSHELKLAIVGRVGVGHLLASLWPAGSQASLAAAVSAFRGRLPKDGSMRVLHCPAEARNALANLQTPTHLESMRAIKRTLDPKDILNRGRFAF